MMMLESSISASLAGRPWLYSGSLLKRPSTLQSAINRVVTYADQTRPVFKNLSLSIVSVIAIVLCVSGLNVFGGPSAVAGFVIPVGVDSVERVAETGGGSHVGIERLERLSPAVANCNSTPTIEPEVIDFRIMASVNHFVPNLVFAKLREPMLLMGLALTALPNVPLQMIVTDPPDSPANQALTLPMPSPNTDHVGAQQLKSANYTSNIDLQFATLRNSHEIFLSLEGNLGLEPHGVSAPSRLVSLYGCSVTNSTGGRA